MPIAHSPKNPAANASSWSPASARQKPPPWPFKPRWETDQRRRNRHSRSRCGSQISSARRKTRSPRPRAQTSRQATGASQNSPKSFRRRRLLFLRRRRAVSSIQTTSTKVSSSTAASPRISNSPAAHGSASAHCAPGFCAHFAPLVRDVVVAGHDRDDVGLLIFADLRACCELFDADQSNLPAAKILEHDLVRSRFRNR